MLPKSLSHIWKTLQMCAKTWEKYGLPSCITLESDNRQSFLLSRRKRQSIPPPIAEQNLPSISLYLLQILAHSGSTHVSTRLLECQWILHPGATEHTSLLHNFYPEVNDHCWHYNFEIGNVSDLQTTLFRWALHPFCYTSPLSQLSSTKNQYSDTWMLPSPAFF